MTQKIQALVDGGNASAGPPLGPQLGPLGVNIGEIVSEINKKTKEFEGMQVPVTVKVDEETKNFEIDVGTPPVSALIKKETKLDSLSSNPHEEKVANLLIEQCIKLGKAKMPDLNSPTLKSAVKQIVASCTTSGVLVENKDPREVIAEIDEGKYDKKIENEKTELTEEEKEELKKEREQMKKEIEEKEEEWREKAEQILKELEASEEEFSKEEKRQKMKGEDIPHEIVIEFLPEEDEEGESEGEEEKIEEKEE